MAHLSAELGSSARLFVSSEMAAMSKFCWTIKKEQSLVVFGASQCIYLARTSLSMLTLDTGCPIHHSSGPQCKTQCKGRSFLLLLLSLVL